MDQRRSSNNKSQSTANRLTEAAKDRQAFPQISQSQEQFNDKRFHNFGNRQLVSEELYAREKTFTEIPRNSDFIGQSAEDQLESNSDSNNYESDEEGEGSEDGPSRWKHNNDLEMDVVFLDEDQKEEDGLPEMFTPESVEQLQSNSCMLCSDTFSVVRLFKHNCRKCGKMVCENCSKARRRLSKLEKTKHRVCDECDALLSNHNLEKMFQREVASKKANYEEMR